MNRATLATSILAAIFTSTMALPVFANDTVVQASTFMEALTYGKPMTNFRLRYEHVDQEGKPKTADALTLRSLVGWQT
ncbi:MAG: hypothetical protein Q8J65_08495, partial [Nitrosomonadales bacterium]|nr:hypothetical protein [Nitrosomonadales bacterium]